MTLKTSHHKVELLESILEYSFSDKLTALHALSHPSIRLKNPDSTTYQRLEFLGDRVLNVIIAEHMLNLFPFDAEGQIAARHSGLVCGKICASVAKKLGIDKCIIMSSAQEKTGGMQNDKILEDAMEAIIGALYLDAGLDFAKTFVVSLWKEFIDNAETGNAKSEAQEWFQKQYNTLPQYETYECDGGFASKITIPNGACYVGAVAKNKKDAEKNAAMELLKSIKNI